MLCSHKNQLWVSLLFIAILCFSANDIKRQARFVMRCNDDKYSRLKYSKLVAPVSFQFPKPGEFDHIFYTEYLEGCDIDRACVIDLMDAAEHGNHAYVNHYLQPGTVYYLPASAKNPKTWLVKNVLQLFEEYNASTKDFTFAHVADESSHWNSEALIQFYQEWKQVYRQTWHFSKEYTALSEAGRLYWLPLTYLRSPHLSPSQMTPSSLRIHNMTFRGNLKTNQGRRSHWKELQRELYKRNKSSMTGTVLKSFAFSQDPTAGGYLREMTESRLCLGMKGISPECYRFYESLECGCIPTFIDQYSTTDYHDTFLPWKTKLMEVQWRRGHELPFIWARNMKEFMKLYDELFFTGPAGLAKLDAMQQETLEWWEAAKLHFKSIYKNALCSFNKTPT